MPCGLSLCAAYLEVGDLQQPHVSGQPVPALDCDNVSWHQLVSVQCDALAVSEDIGCSNTTTDIT